LYLIPELGSRALDTISNEQVQRLKLRLHDKSPKTINNVLSVLNVLLKQAVEWGLVDKMPCSVRLVRVPRTDAAFHDFDDYERLLKAAQTIDPRSYLIALLGGEAGLRAGEIVALEWADVDLERRQIRVRHSDWCGELTAPKNGRIRFVGMTERLAAAIRQQRHLRSSRVLCKDDGTPITRQGAWSRVRYAAKRAKVPTGVHILRHYVLLAPGDAGRTDARGAGARRASESRDDAAVLAPESGGPRRDDPAARKPRDVARSWRQFGDGEGGEMPNVNG
jgi:integrase